jgi:3'(2'), 5'-bisphosphate nucleotidase
VIMKTITIQALAEEAGREILRYYRAGGWSVTTKDDASPVTQADLASNAILTRGLNEMAIAPIVSEENEPAKQLVSPKYWLVDPLDGTKEFIAGRETFVISIGLIENGSPVFGLIHAPVTGETFWAEKGKGAFGPKGPLFHSQVREKLIAAGSRSLNPNDLVHLSLPVERVERIGSALKFCRLASGEIDLYPRFGPTGEWDTAAGQIICEEAGCEVRDLSTDRPLRYGKPQFLNATGFIAAKVGILS